MRVLFLLPSLAGGGAESSLAVTLPWMIKLGVEPLIACFGESMEKLESHLRAQFEQSCEVVVIPGRRPERVAETSSLIRRWKPDIVHSAVMEANLISRIARIGHRTLLINSLVNTPYTSLRYADPKTRWWKHGLLQLVDALTGMVSVNHFHAVNNAVKQESIRSLWIRPDKISVVERGRDLSEYPLGFDRGRKREELGLRDEDFVVICVGRQCYQKGQVFLLKAMERLAGVLPNLTLLLAGREGDSTQEMMNFMNERTIEPKVRFLGHRQDIPGLLLASDLFVMPSLFEGIGGAAIEAMAASLPVVASDIPGLRETLGDQPEFSFHPPMDVEALARGIEIYHNRPDLMKAQGARNRLRFEQNYDTAGSAEKMVELYRNLLSS